MRAIVISDSHGDCASVNMIVSKHRTADMFLFLGDGERDFFHSSVQELLKGKAVIALKGNCDMYSQLPLEETCYLSDKKIYALHGHTKYVKHSLDLVRQYAEEIGADIVVYGHTHIQKVEYQDGIYYMCPGSARNGEYGVIDIDERTNTVLCYTLKE